MNEFGQSTPCAGNIVAIAAGFSHSLLLKADGTVCASGVYYDFQGAQNRPVTVSQGLTDVVELACGMYHNLALRKDGTVVAWGISNQFGQINVPADLNTVVDIAAAGDQSLALKADGTVMAWGYASDQLPSGLTNVVAITGLTRGFGFDVVDQGGLALRGDGTVVGWGLRPQALDPTGRVRALTNVVAFSGGAGNWMAVTVEQTAILSSSWLPESELTGVRAVAATVGNDYEVRLILRTNFTVNGWGFSFGTPVVPDALNNVVAVAAGGTHCLGLVGGGPPFLTRRLVSRSAVLRSTNYFFIEATGQPPFSYQWRHAGTNLPGQTGAVLALKDLRADQAGTYSVIVSNQWGAVTSTEARLELIRFEIFEHPKDLTTFAGATANLSVGVLGGPPLTYQWRRDGLDLPGATNSVLSLTNVQFSQSGSYSVLVRSGMFSLASSNATLNVLPVVGSIQPTGQVLFVGSSITLTLSAQGQVPIGYQWQHNGIDLPGCTTAELTLSNLQLHQSGRYTVELSNAYGVVDSLPAMLSVVQVAAWSTLGSKPQAVPVTLTNVIAIAADMALNADGSVTSWADIDEPTPVLTSITGIAGGGYYAAEGMAFDREGRVITWGGHSFPHPRPPAELSTVVAGALGLSHILALKSDGTVVAWGDSTLGSTTVPAELTDAVAVSAGDAHSLGLRADGTVLAWGAGTYIGSSYDFYNRGQSMVPAGLSNVVAIAAGAMHSLALQANGTVVGWGDNGVGQTQPPSQATNVVAIAAGEGVSLALRADGSVVGWGRSTAIPAELKNVSAIAVSGGNCTALVGAGPPVLRAPLSQVTLSTNGLQVCLPTHGNRLYRLEFKHSLQQPDWTPLPLLRGTGGLQTLLDAGALGGQRFYRVRAW